MRFVFLRPSSSHHLTGRACIAARLMRSTALALFAGWALQAAGFIQPAFADNRGSVSATATQGYGRMIFSFEEAPIASVRASNGILVLEFKQPVELDLEKLPQQLPDYLSLARRDPDGKALRFALVKSVKPDLKEAGEKIYLDLLPESWQGEPPGLPPEVVQELARRAILAEDANRKAQQLKEREAVRDLTVHVGNAPTFSRVIFEMAGVAPVDYKREGDKVTLLFDSAFRIDAAAVRPQLPEAIKSFEVEPKPTSLKITMTIAPELRVNGFREDDSFVLDLPRGSDKPGVLPAPAASGGKRESKQQAAAAASGEVAPQKEAAAPVTTSAELASRQKAAAQPLKPLDDALPAAGPPVEIGAGKITYAKAGDGLRIKIAFQSRPPAAVFVRDDVVWMLFEGVKDLMADPIPPEATSLIGASEIDGVGGAAIFRLRMVQRQVVSVAPEEKGWSVTLGDAMQAPIEPLVLKRGVSNEGRTALVTHLADAGSVFWLDDRQSGARWAIVPSRGKAQALAKDQSFVEVKALASAQGLVIEPVADDLVVKAGLEEVWVTRDGGLSLSLGVEGAKQQGRDGSRSDILIDAAAWRDAGRGVTRDRERDLLRTAAESPQRDRSEARLQLAEFYLANRMATDALGVLGTIAKDDPQLGSTKPVLLARAISEALAHDFDKALKTLNEPALQLEGEAVLWRAFVDANLKRWTPALVGFRQSLDILERYPDRLRVQFLPLIIEAALEAHDLNFAAQQLDLLERYDAIDRDPALVALFRGRIAEASGRIDDAMTNYALAKASKNREIEAKARLFHAILGYDEKRVDPVAAEAELETVAVIWRRDDVELRALAKLGEIYAGSKRWREAFAAAKRAEEILPDHPVTRKFEDEMGSQFEALFLGGQSDDLDKVKALALFYDFRNYTPPGRKGDEIVRRLADRLAELDLLDQASELLHHQVETRLGGIARASVATRLAVIDLQNRKPAEALKVLRDTRLATLPDELRRARALLEARALSELSRTDLAIEMIAARSGPDVDRLRADIYWQGKRWHEAGEAYEMVLGNAWERTQPLTETERSDVLRSGIAYVLGNDRLGLDRLRSKYAARMANTPDTRAFELVTAESGIRAKDFKELARTVVSSDTLAAFLDSYRKRYPQTGGARSTQSLVPEEKAAKTGTEQPASKSG